MSGLGQTELLRKLDGALRDRALVFGSLPPAGRDLDLLVREPERAALTSALEANGFQGRRGMWVRFTGCTVAIVELIPAAALPVRGHELDDLFAEARPLHGMRRLVEPAAHHALLILARRLRHERRLLPKHQARIERELEREPEAWEGAARRAPSWAAEASLERLRLLYSGGSPRRTFNGRAVLRRPRRTRLIALSGEDPDRQRLHAEALSETLNRIGLTAIVESPWRIEPHAMYRDYGRPSALTRWAAPLGALKASLLLWRPLWRRVGRGHVVISQTSPLDIAAAFSFGLPPYRSWSGRLALGVAPRPACSFFFERLHQPARRDAGVPSSLAQAYAGVPRRLGVRRLSASLTVDETCVEVATAAFEALVPRARRGR